MKKLTYTKIVIGTVTMTYFFGVIFGAVIVYKHPEYTGEYLAYIGAATSIAIGFYEWKAKAENEIKLRKSYSKQQVQLVEKIKQLDDEQKARYEQINLEVEEMLNKNNF